MDLRHSTFFVLVLASLSTILLADDTDLEIRPMNETALETLPDRNVTAVFSVTNHMADAREFISEVDLPEGWKLISQNLPFELGENETDITLLSFYIPQSTPRGVYTLLYHIRCRQIPEIHSYIAYAVSVRPYLNYNLEILKAPQQVIAGDTYDVTLQLMNKSNVDDTIFVDITDSHGFVQNARMGPYFLEAGSSRSVDIGFRPDSGILHPQKHRTVFSLTRSRDTRPFTSVRVMVDIVPRIQGINDPFHRIPLEISAAFISQKLDGKKAAAGYQGDIRGEGTLTEAGDSRLYCHFRGPDAYYRSLSVYAEREEYVAGYQSPRIGLHVGDRSYSLSDLTQFSRYGRGVEFNVRPFKKCTFGSFYQKSHWSGRGDRSAAAMLQYDATASLQSRLNWIQLKNHFGEGRILSLSNQYRWSGDSRAEVEYAYGTSVSGQASGSAFKTLLSGRIKGSWIHVNWIYAAPDFMGYFRDTNYLTANLHTAISSKWRFQAVYNYTKKNIEQDTSRFDAPVSHMVRTGLDYYHNANIKADFTANYRSNRDRLNRFFDYIEQSVRAQLSSRVADMSLSVSGEWGTVHNNIYHNRSAMSRYGLTALYKYREVNILSGFLQYENSNRFSADKRRSVIAGFNINALLGGKTRLNFQWQNDYSLEEYYSDRNTMNLAVRHMLPFGHHIQIKGRRTLLKYSKNRTDLAFLAEYLIPLGVPVSRRQDLCIVRGRVVDVETQQPLKNLVIHINGSTAATDRNGHFGFYNLTEKTYYLTIDKSSMGMNKVTVKPLPLEITTVRGGEGQYVEIGVIRSGALSGRVLLAKNTAGTDSADQGLFLMGSKTSGKSSNGSGHRELADSTTMQTLANIVVEMSRGDEVIRRVTDAGGRFVFEELRPGKWQVRCIDKYLPEYHQMEKSVIEVDIEPGEGVSLDIHIVPKRRAIRMLRESEMIVKEKRKDW
ncbi:hypothetical protein JW948_12305 [bacterium]|nr:hypothetical protein [bacterium]